MKSTLFEKLSAAKLILKVVTLLFIFIVYQKGFAQCHMVDWTALKDLHSSTNGNNWLNQTNWEVILPNSPPANCNLNKLFGISTNVSGRVDKINLYDNNLSGLLPNTLGLLSGLSELFLGYDPITGTIPNDIGNLVELRVLSITDCAIEGSIPTTINQLQNLAILYLYNNQLSGILPTKLSDLLKLEILFLQNNQLTGTLPAGLANISTLNRLYIADNQLSGCYPANWVSLCNQLTFGLISQGNNLEATWAEFCESQAGSCQAVNLSNVWPGDVNFDGIVNGMDVMHLGNYLYQDNNLNLPEQSNWQAYPRPDWDIDQYNGFCNYGYDDLKHADCDGNGTIDSLDYEVIVKNWNQSHDDAPIIQPIVPCFFFDDFSDYSLSLQPVGSVNNNLFIFDLALSNTNAPVKIQGGFLRINYFHNTNELDVLDANITLSNSWLGSPNQNLWYHDVFNAADQYVEAGFTKTDLSNSEGAGVIGQVAFLFDDFDATVMNNIVNFNVELGFQNRDTSSVLLKENFKVNLGESPCENNLMLNNEMPFQDTYKCNNILTTAGELTIHQTQNVSYYAGETIILNKGFFVETGATFEALNGKCDK